MSLRPGRWSPRCRRSRPPPLTCRARWRSTPSSSLTRCLPSRWSWCYWTTSRSGRPRSPCSAATRSAPGVKLESSGGLSLENAHAYATTGVDYLAVGALTHSVRVLDIGLDL